MVNSIAYNKAEARTLLHNYSLNHPQEFFMKVSKASFTIDFTLNLISSLGLIMSKNKQIPAMDYDFTAHEIVDCNNESPSKLAVSTYLKTMAMRDYMAAQATVLGWQCGDPEIPHSGAFISTYLQAKLLRDSGCSSVSEYVERPSLINFGNRLRSFLSTILRDFKTRDQKKIAKNSLLLQDYFQRAQRASTLPPSGALGLMCSIPIIPGPSTPKITHEPFIEISLNNQKFAFFIDAIDDERILIDMPKHSLFFFGSVHAATCYIHGAAVFIYNDIQTDQPGRGMIKSEGELVIFATTSPFYQTYSLEGHPIRKFDDTEAVTFGKSIINLMQQVTAVDGTKSPMIPRQINHENAVMCLTTTAQYVIGSMTFEQIQQKFELPATTSEQQFVESMNMNLWPMLKYHNLMK